MLETVKNYIANLPDKDFGQFFQEYVLQVQDSIVEHDVDTIQCQCKTSSDINQVFFGIDRIAKELNTK